MTALTVGPLSLPSCSYQGHASPRLLPAANPFLLDRELLLLVTGSGSPHRTDLLQKRLRTDPLGSAERSEPGAR